MEQIMWSEHIKFSQPFLIVFAASTCYTLLRRCLGTCNNTFSLRFNGILIVQHTKCEKLVYRFLVAIPLFLHFSAHHLLRFSLGEQISSRWTWGYGAVRLLILQLPCDWAVGEWCWYCCTYTQACKCVRVKFKIPQH